MANKLRPFGNFRADEQAEEFMEWFGKWEIEYGRDKVEQGINDAIEDTTREKPEFCPSPTEFLVYIQRSRPGYAPKFGAAKRDCKRCDGTGWRPIDKGKERRLTECECRQLFRQTYLEGSSI